MLLPNSAPCPNPLLCCPNAGAPLCPKIFVPALPPELVLLAPKEKVLALLVLDAPKSPAPPALEAGALAAEFVACPNPELAPKDDWPKVKPLAELVAGAGCPKPAGPTCPKTDFPKAELVAAAPKVVVPNAGAEVVAAGCPKTGAGVLDANGVTEVEGVTAATEDVQMTGVKLVTDRVVPVVVVTGWAKIEPGVVEDGAGAAVAAGGGAGEDCSRLAVTVGVGVASVTEVSTAAVGSAGGVAEDGGVGVTLRVAAA